MSRERHRAQHPPRHDHVPDAYPPRESRSAETRPDGSSQRRNARRNSVQRAQQSQTPRRVREQDGAAGESEHAGEALEEHDAEDGDLLRVGCGEEDGEGGEEVDEWVEEGDEAETVEGAVVACEGWEDDKLEDHGGYAVCGGSQRVKAEDMRGRCTDCEDQADAAGLIMMMSVAETFEMQNTHVQPKSTCKFERKPDIRIVGSIRLGHQVEKDWNKLIVGGVMGSK